MTSQPRRTRSDTFRLKPSDLPAAHEMHWSARRKALVVAAVTGGLLDLADACRRYDLSVEEYASWAAAFHDSDYADLLQSAPHGRHGRRPVPRSRSWVQGPHRLDVRC